MGVRNKLDDCWREIDIDQWPIFKYTRMLTATSGILDSTGDLKKIVWDRYMEFADSLINEIFEEHEI